MLTEKAAMYSTLGISKEVFAFGTKIEEELKERFAKIDEIAEYNQLKVIHAMQASKVSEACLYGTTGYGYNDLGRDTLEQVYATCFGTEDALVRPQIACGTHALATALSGNLRPGDELLSPVGKPYDTLEEVIGIRPSVGSLAEYGVTYRQVDLKEDGSFDYEEIKNAINKKTKMVTIQRSKGYQTRPTLSVTRIGELIAFIKNIKPDVICMVDNCYGEFVETIEPTNVGADLMVGSLIKNPGGGLAPAGGYIVGKKKYVENAAYRLLSPGLGKEVGATLGVNGSFYQGFFLAPTVTAAALKGAVFAANVYEKLGFAVVPNGTESRHDIIQAVTFGKPEGVIAFCRRPDQTAVRCLFPGWAYVAARKIRYSDESSETRRCRYGDIIMAKNVVIIGGGASGLMAAIWASRLGAAVTVLEKNDKPGRKLLATGNGRCNFTNRYQDASCYRTGNQERASRVLEQFTEQDTEQFFEQLGIRIRSREGWLYPASEQAQSVLDLLVLEARFRKVKIKTRETAVAVEKAENGYLVRTEGWQYPADSVIICCGSCASQIAGSDGDTLRFADQLQLASIPFSPALCPLRCKGNQFSSWAGVRVRAKITLLVENQEILTEQGEMQLTDYGVSGIPVFQISRFAVRACMQKKRAELLVDFFPELTESELTAELVRRQEICPYKAPKELLIGLLPEKLIPVLIGKKKTPEEMAGAIKSYRLQITGQTDFGKAQVCAGGITLDQLTDSLESLQHPGIFFAGEALDVDGVCGGYNLQWAWSSGSAAGRAAAGEHA